jgi:long-chain acyl-CoA synthetase
VDYTWQQEFDGIEEITRALARSGVGHGDRVLLLGEVDLEMLWTTYALWQIGAASVSVWPGGGPGDIAEVVRDTAPAVAVVRGRQQVEQIVADPDSTVRTIVTWSEDCGDIVSADVSVLTFAAFLERPAHGADRPASEVAGHVRPEDITGMFRTSGSTGVPKLACHTHASLIAGTRAFLNAFPAGSGHDHVPNFNVAAPAEPVVGTVSHLLSGMRLNFCETADSYDRDVVERSPHYMWLLPFQWESRLAQLPSDLMADEARQRLGLADTRWAITGGYAIAPKAVERLRALGVELHTIYASAEMLIVSSGPLTEDVHSVGRLFPEVEYRIDDDGLSIRWPGLFREYWNRPSVLDDGWYLTGDNASVAADRGLRILGRSEGAGVSVEEAEARLRDLAYLQDAFCQADGNLGVVAVVSLRAGTEESTGARLPADLAAINEGLEPPVALCVVLNRQFEASRGELTPTGKLRRAVLADHFSSLIESVRSGETPDGDVDRVIALVGGVDDR